MKLEKFSLFPFANTSCRNHNKINEESSWKLTEAITIQFHNITNEKNAVQTHKTKPLNSTHKHIKNTK